MGKTPPVLGFTHDRFFLSNSFPCEIEFEGAAYPAAENAFQAAKSPFGYRARFEGCTAREARRLGRSSPMTPESLAAWDAGRRVWVMVEVNMPKYLTHKGAVRARKGDMGIIPGSMGARSFIVRGLGNPDSLHSCSHGAGRAMSRTEALERFTVADHIAATQGIECAKDEGVLDETPGAYKDIDAVMHAQRDLVEIAHTLHQIVCVKGGDEKHS